MVFSFNCFQAKKENIYFQKGNDDSVTSPAKIIIPTGLYPEKSLNRRRVTVFVPLKKLSYLFDKSEGGLVLYYEDLTTCFRICKRTPPNDWGQVDINDANIDQKAKFWVIDINESTASVTFIPLIDKYNEIVNNPKLYDEIKFIDGDLQRQSDELVKKKETLANEPSKASPQKVEQTTSSTVAEQKSLEDKLALLKKLLDNKG